MPDKIYFRRGLIADLPTLAQGEPGFALDSKKLYIGTATGNQGIVSSAPTLATWIAPTLLNAWVNFGGAYAPAGYHKNDLGIVRIRGLISGGTATSGTVLFTLPAGYRPLYNKLLPTYSNAVFGSLVIKTNGDVCIDSGTNATLSLEVIEFRAEQ